MNKFIASFKTRLDNIEAGFESLDELTLDQLAELREEVKFISTCFAVGPKMCRDGRKKIHDRVQMIQIENSESK